jgi:hypothetical protein
MRRQDHRLFAHLLTSALFVQAALRCGLQMSDGSATAGIFVVA